MDSIKPDFRKKPGFCCGQNGVVLVMGSLWSVSEIAVSPRTRSLVCPEKKTVEEVKRGVNKSQLFLVNRVLDKEVEI